jgi:hypothetical protein
LPLAAVANEVHHRGKPLFGAQPVWPQANFSILGQTSTVMNVGRWRQRMTLLPQRRAVCVETCATDCYGACSVQGSRLWLAGFCLAYDRRATHKQTMQSVCREALRRAPHAALFDGVDCRIEIDPETGKIDGAKSTAFELAAAIRREEAAGMSRDKRAVNTCAGLRPPPVLEPCKHGLHHTACTHFQTTTPTAYTRHSLSFSKTTAPSAE